MNSHNTSFNSIRSRNEKNASLLLMLLLSTDFVFILLYIIHQRNIPFLQSPLFDIGQDLGYAEVYQYIEYFWIILLFIYILISTKCLNYISWIVVFTYFLCDDALQIHERLGGLIANSFHFFSPFSLRLQDFGELVVSAAVGILLLIILVWAYWHGSHTFKKISVDLGFLLIALVFFGVFIDLVHVAFSKLAWYVEECLEILEDGGEMIVVSLMLWYVFLQAVSKGDSDLFLLNLFPGFLKRIKR